MANRLINVAWGPINISAAAVVYTYTATTSSFVQFQPFVSNAAGGGDYVAYIRKQRAGAGANYVIGPKTTSTFAAGETAIGFESLLIYCHAADVVQIYIDGLIGDIACNGFIEITELTALDEVVEGAYTLRHLIRLMAAALYGEVSGGGTVKLLSVTQEIR